MDESAYISQSFYGDLLCTGRRDHPAWLDYAGFDLPPLPKYLIAGALWAANFRRPDLSDARSWYRDTSRQFVPLPALVAARRPSVVLGAIGCLAIFWIGTILGDRRVGCLAARPAGDQPALPAARAAGDVRRPGGVFPAARALVRPDRLEAGGGGDCRGGGRGS